MRKNICWVWLCKILFFFALLSFLFPIYTQITQTNKHVLSPNPKKSPKPTTLQPSNFPAKFLETYIKSQTTIGHCKQLLDIWMQIPNITLPPYPTANVVPSRSIALEKRTFLGNPIIFKVQSANFQGTSMNKYFHNIFSYTLRGGSNPLQIFRSRKRCERRRRE